MRSARPACVTAATESPPPTTETSRALPPPRRRRACRGERLQLEDAHRPVPEDRARIADAPGVARGGSGPDIEGEPAVGHVVGSHHARRGIGREASAATTSVGSFRSQPAATAADAASRAIAWPASSSCSEAPTWPPAARTKVLAIAPPIRIVSATVVSRSMTPILSVTLNRRRRRRMGVPARRGGAWNALTSRSEEMACRRRQEMRDALRRRRGRGARRRRRRSRTRRRASPGWRRTPGRSALRVDERRFSSRRRRLHRGGPARDRFNAIADEPHPSQLGQPLGHRSQRQLRDALTLRPAQVRADHEIVRALAPDT